LDITFYLLLLVMAGIFINENLSKYYENKKIEKFAAENLKHSVNDLLKIKSALELYYSKYGSYPVSIGTSGILSCWGESSVDWIKGLSPEFIDHLPNNLANSKSCAEQYLYKSDGKDYKLIHHNPKDCFEMKMNFPFFIDPERDCWAYGIWTTNATHF